MKKILIIDDDKDLLAALKSFLQKQSYDVMVSISCSEGLEIVDSFRPDLIFLDINVGSEDGREMCKKIKSHAEHKHIVVILISANDAPLKEYQKSGANSFLRKPFQPGSLLNVIAVNL